MRGRLNWRIAGCWLKIENAASNKALEKNIHGNIPARANRAKCFIPSLITTVKTKVIAAIINKGFIIAQKIPRKDPEYFTLS